MDLKSLIGLEVGEAKKLISADSENKINVIINSKPNDKCDTRIVCNVKQENGVINLYCGEFYLNMKR
ncbi:MAG: hypothetical protein J6J33_02630 [Clostridia bacterium]|nr:hypothetical protein [Clostridia bacterium]